jgi:hypothetical protein
MPHKRDANHYGHLYIYFIYSQQLRIINDTRGVGYVKFTSDLPLFARYLSRFNRLVGEAQAMTSDLQEPFCPMCDLRSTRTFSPRIGHSEKELSANTDRHDERPGQAL